MINTQKLKFQKSQHSKQNIEIFFRHLKRHKSPYSFLLLNALKQNISEEEFRQKIKDDVLGYIEKISSRSK